MTIYAINKRTKEHMPINHLMTQLGLTRDWRIVEADEDGWIPWSGGECPLPDYARHKVMFAGGEEVFGEPQLWNWDDTEDPIFAYHPILNADNEPEASEWDGVGLPPVGCEFEIYPYFHKCHIVCEYKDGVVVHDLHDDGFFLAKAGEHRFRPIRTAEDQAVDEMLDVISNSDLAGTLGSLPTAACRALYRAGYRKENI